MTGIGKFTEFVNLIFKIIFDGIQKQKIEHNQQQFKLKYLNINTFKFKVDLNLNLRILLWDLEKLTQNYGA